MGCESDVAVALEIGAGLAVGGEPVAGVAAGVGSISPMHDALFVTPAISARLSLIRSISLSPALQGCPHTPQLNARTTPASATAASPKASLSAIDPSSAMKSMWRLARDAGGLAISILTTSDAQSMRRISALAYRKGGYGPIRFSGGKLPSVALKLNSNRVSITSISCSSHSPK